MRTCRIKDRYNPRIYFVVPCSDPTAAWDVLQSELASVTTPEWSPGQFDPAEFIITLDAEPHDTVGQRFRNHAAYQETPEFICTSYDSRSGFWMQNEADPKNKRNVSERAIGRTYHRIYDFTL